MYNTNILFMYTINKYIYTLKRHTGMYFVKIYNEKKAVIY